MWRIVSDLRGPAELHKPTHYTDRETEAQRGPVAKGPEKQVDFPWTPIKSKACRDSSMMTHAVLAAKKG